MRFRRMERKNETLYRTSPAPYGGTLPKGEGLRLRRETIIYRSTCTPAEPVKSEFLHKGKAVVKNYSPRKSGGFVEPCPIILC